MKEGIEMIEAITITSICIVLVYLIIVAINIRKIKKLQEKQIDEWFVLFQDLNKEIIDQINERDSINKVLYHGMNIDKESQLIYEELFDRYIDDSELLNVVIRKESIVNLIKSNITFHSDILNGNSITHSEELCSEDNAGVEYDNTEMVDITDHLL